MGMMGWWHPYFFSDTAGVQLLIPQLAVANPDGDGAPLIVVLVLVLVLCFGERWAGRCAKVSRLALDRRASGQGDETTCGCVAYCASTCGSGVSNDPARHRMKALLLHTSIHVLHTGLHFLIMLVVMSFNAVLFVVVLAGE